MARATVIVMDACGVGASPDAADYGDEGANTLGHLAQLAGGLELPAVQALGLGSIVALEGVPPATAPVVHGRLAAQGPGACWPTSARACSAGSPGAAGRICRALRSCDTVAVKRIVVFCGSSPGRRPGYVAAAQGLDADRRSGMAQNVPNTRSPASPSPGRM